MKISVECSLDYKGHERPMRFLLGARAIEVEEIVDRWHGEAACYYRVLGNDENLYIIQGPLDEGVWELISFTHKDSRGTELEFQGKAELQ